MRYLRLAMATAMLMLVVAMPARAVDVDAQVRTARAYWFSQGLVSGCQTGITIMKLSDGLAGRGWPFPWCRIFFDPLTLRYPSRTFCHLAVHEYGHVVGLAHADADRFPIMNPKRIYTARMPFCDGAAKIGRLAGPRRRAPRVHLYRLVPW